LVFQYFIEPQSLYTTLLYDDFNGCKLTEFYSTIQSIFGLF
jgi:hypothetical protein